MDRRITVRSLIGAALACAVLAGCGGDDEKRPEGVDLTAMRCPLVSKGVVDGVEKFEPAKDAFDAATLIGKPLGEAEQAAAAHGCTIVVSIQDDKGLPVSTGIDPARITVHTADGAVTEIEGVGGGL